MIALPAIVSPDEVEARMAAQPPGVSLDTRLAAVEADVADLDAIIVAVLS